MIQRCAICNTSIDNETTFGKIPVSGYVVDDYETAKKEPRFELTLLKCNSCGLIQLKQDGDMLHKILNIYKIYQPTYSMSMSVQSSVVDMLKQLKHDNKLTDGDFVVEIGCNDGTTLDVARSFFGFKVLGIEPSERLSEMCKERRVPVINDFFTWKIYFDIPRVIIARHVLEHVSDPRVFIRTIVKHMDEHTVLAVEVPSADALIWHWEGIAHPHLYYFSQDTLFRLLNDCGLTILSSKRVPTDGGSILVTAKKKTKIEPEEIKHLINDQKRTIIRTLEQLRGKTVYGFGAGKGSTILNIVGIDDTLVKYVVDDDPTKHNKFVPGCGIKIVSSDYLYGENEPDYLLMLAPTHSEEIRKKLCLKYPNRKFKFIEIIPVLKIED